MIKQIRPEEYNETYPGAEEEDPPLRNDLTFIHGRIFNENGKWIFESFKHVFEKKDYADIVGTLSKLYSKTTSDYLDQLRQIDQAQNVIKKSQEAKKLQDEAAKKKAKNAPAKKGAKPV